MIGLLALGAGGLLAYAAISRRTADSVLTAPMFFTGFGLLLHTLVGDHGDLHVEADWLHLVAEITLVIVLFTDASRIDVRELRYNRQLPLRLLGLGLPLTLLLGAAVAILVFPGMGWCEAALIAAILAPTDAALGQAVVSNPAVPANVRQALNVESGLNDGIALPAVLISLYAFEIQRTAEVDNAYWAWFIGKQVLLGPVVGALVGLFGGRLVDRASASGWMSKTFQELSAIGLAVLAFAAAELVGGNGFLGAFVGGMVLGNTARGACDRLAEFGETEGQLMTLLTFTAFGALLVPFVFEHATWPAFVYAMLSLTVIRALPVALALFGTRSGTATVAFLAWFGPRGIASLLFGLVVLERAGMEVAEQVLSIVAFTVLLSIVLHGVSAAPLARRYGNACGNG